jgi:gluconate 2-dehydrogenase gamma chain
MKSYTRRDFIKQMGLIYGSIMLYPSCSKKVTSYDVFTDDEAECLIALCERIIPADRDAGATDAGVIRFIDRQTRLRFPKDLPAYQTGIAALQSTCKVKYGMPFEKLDSSLQVEMMKNMEQGQLPKEYWEGISQQSFFNLVLDRTMQGFYGPPRHGGNKNYVSYRMLRLDYPLLVGQNRYRHGS